MTWLHVAAMPFPTRQGTQTVLREMCAASAAAGRETHLFTYAAGERDAPLGFELHRAGDFPRVRSLRSGPSAGKLALDARMTLELARLRRRLSPGVVVAHHVEAATMAALTGRFVFFAHTDLGAELPTYAHARFASPLARAGRVLDRALVRRADGVAAISPVLADRLRALADGATPVGYVPAPWPVPPPTDDAERAAARRDLALAVDARVVLYAGNLDAYQGWDGLLDAFARYARQDAGAHLLVGTMSDAGALQGAARRAGIAARLSVRGIDTEASRRMLHAAADVAAIPRLTPGGLPMKLLDALARGVACVVAPTATAGLALDGIAHVARDNDAGALARALADMLTRVEQRRALSLAGPKYVAAQHSRARFLDALDAIAGRAR